MGKHRYKTLYAEMKKLDKRVQTFLCDVENLLNFIKDDFYVKYRFVSVQRMPLPTVKVVQAVCTSGFGGPHDFSEVPQVQEIWGLRALPLNDNKDWLVQRYQKTILFCPDDSELKEAGNWFEDEEDANSLFYIMLTIDAINLENQLLQNNLLSCPKQSFLEALHEWHGDPNCPDTLEKDFDSHLNKHAPYPGQTIALAWEYTKTLLKMRRHRNIEIFLRIYLRKLEAKIFLGIPRDIQSKERWFKNWENNLFKKKSRPPQPYPGRWEQGTVVDVATAAKFMEYFMTNFFIDQNDFKSAETVCILWLLLWCAHEGRYDVTINDILNLSTDNFLSSGRLEMKDKPLQISKGLLSLLKCLFGEGTGIHTKRLFTYVKNRKTLERQLHDASTNILGNNITPVLPSAFSNFPHIWPEIRISWKERQGMRSARKIIKTRPNEDFKTLIIGAIQRKVPPHRT